MLQVSSLPGVYALWVWSMVKIITPTGNMTSVNMSMAFSMNAVPAETYTQPAAFDPVIESSLRSMSRPLTKCPDKGAPDGLDSSRTLDWRDDGNLTRNFIPTGPVASCLETRSQNIAFPRMASEYMPCSVQVIEPWAVARSGAATRLQAKDAWTMKCGHGGRYNDA